MTTKFTKLTRGEKTGKLSHGGRHCDATDSQSRLGVWGGPLLPAFLASPHPSHRPDKEAMSQKQK